MIHFILIGDEFPWQYRRAIETAAIHDREITLWHTGARPDVPAATCRIGHLLPELPADTPRAHIWDLLAYSILYRHGGTCLGLDTISVRPMDWLNDSREIGVGLDVPTFPYWHPDHRKWVDHPYNNNGISAWPFTSLMGWLYEEALRRIRRGGNWGDTGPAILTELVQQNLDRVQIAPFPQLCGWEGSYTWRFYQGEEPGPDVRVIHLFATAYPQEFAKHGQPVRQAV